MATTAGGLPYPIGTELVKDGDNAIKALADALQARGGALLVQRGSVLVDLLPSGQVGYLWPIKFSGTPTVTFSSDGASGLVIVFNTVGADFNGMTATAMQITPAGAVIRTGSTWMHYVAVGPA